MCTENYELAQQEAVLFAKQHLALAAQNIERQQFIVPDIISCVAQAVTDGSDASEFLASGLDESQKSIILASIPLDAEVEIEGMDAGMSETTAKVKVSLKQGGEMTYDVDFVREGLGWAVSSISTDFSIDEKTE